MPSTMQVVIYGAEEPTIIYQIVADSFEYALKSANLLP